MEKKKNMYENLEMIELEDLSDMADIFCEVWHRSDKMIPVALVADRGLVEYVMDLMIDSDATFIKYINLTEEEDDIPGEWMIMIDENGGITVEELMFYSDLDKAHTVFISMEGDISQNCIDYCLAHNDDVYLFGYPDDEKALICAFS